VDVTPALEIEIEPCTLTRSIVSANAATGNTNANSAKTQTRLIFSSKDLIAVSQSSPYERYSVTTVCCIPECICITKVLQQLMHNVINHLRASSSAIGGDQLKFSAHLQTFDFGLTLSQLGN
jgi:hypothetical protein